MTTEKFCTKCGKKFVATGREVICPACKEQAAEENKKAAVMRAKRASWAGESVPVRISGRASTIIRCYGAEKSLPFAAALDELLKSTDCFKGMSIKWEEVMPYKSHRRDKHATEEAPQEVKQDTQDATESPSTVSKPQEGKQVAQAARKPVKTSTSKVVKTSKATSKSTSKK